MPRSKPNPPCRWWEHDDGFDARSYYTDCCKGMPLKGVSHELACCVWADDAPYCPWCGGEIWFCDEDEVIADEQAEAEYREGIRYGLYGYGE